MIWIVFDNLGREINEFEGDSAQEAIQAAKDAGYKDAAIAEQAEDEPENPWHITGRNF